MNSSTILGLIAGFFTTLAFFPQAYKVYKTRHTRDLSLKTFCLLIFGVSLWLLYGIIVKDIPVIAANGITLPLVLYIVVMKIRHG